MRSTKGTTLLEAVLALAVLAVVTIAVVLLLSQITSLTNTAKRRNQAIALMEQNLEKIRSYYQTQTWVVLNTKTGLCYPDGELTSNQACMTDCNTAVTDQLGNVKVSADAVTGGIRVDSDVYWMDKGSCQHVTAATYFYNY